MERRTGAPGAVVVGLLVALLGLSLHVLTTASGPADGTPTPAIDTTRARTSAGSTPGEGTPTTRASAPARASPVATALHPGPSSPGTGTATAAPSSLPSPAGSGPARGPAAHAGSAHGCDHRCRGRRILGLTPLRPPTGWDLDFEPGRDGHAGMTWARPRRRIVIWVRDDLTDRQLAATLLHEVAHAHDLDGLGGRGDPARREWARMRGFAWDGRPDWFGNGCDGCSDYAVGAGDLAESVHACYRPGYDAFRSQLAGPPTDTQCDFVRSLFG